MDAGKMVNSMEKENWFLIRLVFSNQGLGIMVKYLEKVP